MVQRLTVARLALRDGRRCIHCGATEGLTVQHRAVKGMGGRQSAELPSNGIILCWALNTAAEADADVAEACRAAGWKVSSHTDPATVPVWDAMAREWVVLGDDWSRSPVA